jgi:RNA polymerase-binding transcription factor DksA
MSPTNLLHSSAATTLQRREAELRALLEAGHDAALEAHDAAHEVTDFKDVADEASQAALDDVAATHAAVELAQVLAAQRRLAEGRYGHCTVCGAAIEPKRLLALPHTPFCTSCQAERERAAQRSR